MSDPNELPVCEQCDESFAPETSDALYERRFCSSTCEDEFLNDDEDEDGA